MFEDKGQGNRYEGAFDDSLQGASFDAEKAKVLSSLNKTLTNALRAGLSRFTTTPENIRIAAQTLSKALIACGASDSDIDNVKQLCKMAHPDNQIERVSTFIISVALQPGPTDHWSELNRYVSSLKNVAAKNISKKQTESLAGLFTLVDSAPDHPDTILQAIRISRINVKKGRQISEFAAASRLIKPVDSTENSRHVTEKIRLNLVERATQRNWKTQTIARMISFCSQYVTNTGQEVRSEILALDRGKANRAEVERQLRWVSSWEHRRDLSEIEISGIRAVRESPHRVAFVNGIMRLSHESKLEDCYKLILSSQEESQLSERILAQYLKKVPNGWLFEEVTKRYRQTVAEIEELKEIGVPLDLISLSDASQKIIELYQRGREELIAAGVNADEMKRIVEALGEFYLRKSTNAPYKHDRIGEFLSGMKQITSKGLWQGLLEDSRLRRKLILCLTGKGLSRPDMIMKGSEFQNLLMQLHAHHSMSKLNATIDTNQRRDLLEKYVTKDFESDNPPFSISGKKAQPKAIRDKFRKEITEVLTNQEDMHYGFWANTYTMRHTPLSKQCLFDEFTYGCGADLKVIPSTDIDKFPGPGRVIQGLDLSTIFHLFDEDPTSDGLDTWRKEYLSEYGPHSDYVHHLGNVHALDLLAHARTQSYRAGWSTAVPGNDFLSIEGEEMTLVESNHHFDASGPHWSLLVPSRAFNAFFDEHIIDYDPDSVEYPGKAHGLIAADPPTINNLRRTIKRMNLPVGIIDISNGSIVEAGLCNGAEFGSQPAHQWELECEHYRDNFGRFHKWNIKENEVILGKLWGLHKDINRVATTLHKVRDLFRISMGLDARGYTLRYEPDQQASIFNSEPLLEQNRRRLFNLFAAFTTEYREIGMKKEQYPNLVIAPMKKWAAPVSGPVVMDGKTGFIFHQWGAPFECEFENGMPSERMVHWWKDHIDPYLDEPENFWYAPRLVARENTLDLMSNFGYKKS